MIKYYFILIFTLLLLAGCANMDRDLAHQIIVVKNNVKTEIIYEPTKAVRPIIKEASLSSQGILIFKLDQAIYEIGYSVPINQEWRITDRHLARLVAAGGVFFTAGLAYFNKDFDRAWGTDLKEQTLIREFPVFGSKRPTGSDRWSVNSVISGEEKIQITVDGVQIYAGGINTLDGLISGFFHIDLSKYFNFQYNKSYAVKIVLTDFSKYQQLPNFIYAKSVNSVDLRMTVVGSQFLQPSNPATSAPRPLPPPPSPPLPSSQLQNPPASPQDLSSFESQCVEKIGLKRGSKDFVLCVESLKRRRQR